MVSPRFASRAGREAGRTPLPAAAGPVFVRGSRAPFVAKPRQRVDAAGALRAARTQMRTEFVEQPGFVPTTKLMLPNSNYPPARTTELSGDQPVPRPVALDLVAPERSAGPRPGGVPGAAVPETAVHKHGDAEPREDEVGANASPGLGSGYWSLGILNPNPRSQTPDPGPNAQRTAPSPARDAIRPENLNQPPCQP
jgi:hypothetical protein